MTAVKEAFASVSAGTQVTCTIASLASGSTRETAVVDNTTNLCLDYMVEVTFTIASGTPSSSGGAVNIYANGNPDGSSLWPIIQLSSGVPYTTGAGDASVGALGTSGPVLIGVFGIASTTSASERTFRTEPMSVATAFGNVCPPKFSIMIENQTGVAFSSSTATTANYVLQNGVWNTNA